MSFTFNRLDAHTMRCSHRGRMTLQDSRQLRAILKTLDCQLLLDWTGTPAEDCARQLLTVRPMLPRTAIVGAAPAGFAFKNLPGKDFYLHEVRYFEAEEDALRWLREDAYTPRARCHAPCVVEAPARS